MRLRLGKNKAEPVSTKPVKAVKPVAKKEVAPAPVVEEIAREVDEKLLIDVVPVEERETALQKALKEEGSVSDAELAEGLPKLEITQDVRGQMTDLLMKSLLANKLTVDQLVGTLQAHCEKTEDALKMITSTLGLFNTKWGERKLMDMVKVAEVDLCSVLAPELGGEALDSFLKANGLFCLKPVNTDITKSIEALLASDAAPEKILEEIKSNVDDKLSLTDNLLPLVSAHVLAKVFADPKSPDAEVIKNFAPVLARCLSNDVVACTKFLFDLQVAWFDAGKIGKNIKPLFVQCYDLKLCAYEAYEAWSNDTSPQYKKKGKLPCLVKVNSWLTSIKPSIPRDDYDEDYDGQEEEEDLDEYYKNPNRDFF